MEVLSEEDLANRLNYMRPLKPEPEPRETAWCIPFEYGSNVKGTRISVALAKQIAAELRAAVAEYEVRELRRHFDREVEIAKEAGKRRVELETELFAAKGQIVSLERRLRARKKAR